MYLNCSSCFYLPLMQIPCCKWGCYRCCVAICDEFMKFVSLFDTVLFNLSPSQRLIFKKCQFGNMQKTIIYHIWLLFLDTNHKIMCHGYMVKPQLSVTRKYVHYATVPYATWQQCCVVDNCPLCNIYFQEMSIWKHAKTLIYHIR